MVALESLPLLPSGKVNRRALPPPPELGAGAEKEEYVAPVDEVGAGAALVATWSRAAERATCFLSFFSCGGAVLHT